MSDFETVIEMLKRAKIPHLVERRVVGDGGYAGDDPRAATLVRCASWFRHDEIPTVESDADGSRFVGYVGFEAAFFFDAEGTLIQMGSWE